MAVIFGAAGAPSQATFNYDALFSQSLAAYKTTMIDNIGASNAFFHEVLKGDLYESDEGSHITVPLMYALAPADSYDGNDELSTAPTDGVTEVIFQWRQCASPITYSMREMKMSKRKITSLVKTKIMQSEMGLQEYFSQSLMLGAAADGGSLIAPRTSPINGSLSIEPLFKLVQFDPTAVSVVGNIDQNAQSWWRNKTATSAATTYDGLMLEIDHSFNSAALGTGGRPTLILMDQISYELTVHAIYQKYRQTQSDNNFPFENTTYKNAHIVMDDKTPDVFSGTTSAATFGTALYLNSKFMGITYEADSDFAMLKDDQGKTFAKPINGDSRLGHMGWMGNTTISNRRKQAVLGKIARTLVTP